jgi:hypothetical protein
MSILYISEYTELPTAQFSGYRPMAPEPSVIDQTIAIGGSSAASLPFSGKTNFVRIHTDSICSIQFSNASTTATATTVNKRLAINQTEYFSVTPGGTVAVISNV